MAFGPHTESLARASGRHPWRVIALWVLLFIAAGFLVFNYLGDVLTTEAQFTNQPEAKRGLDLLEQRLRGPERAKDIVIITSDEFEVDDPAFKNVAEDLFARIMGLGGEVIHSGVSYYQTGDPSLISGDRHTTILLFTIAGERADAQDKIDPLHEIVNEFDDRDGFHVLVTGMATVGKDFQEIADRDLQRGEVIGIPVALIILVLVFGAIVAAILPIVLALVAIVIALGAATLVGQAFDLSFFVTNMIMMMGLAVGIDYSLFIVSRYREERRRGLEKLEAISVAGATASRTVFFSGMAVVLALLGLMMVPTTIFRSLSLGAILVVTLAVLASLTLLPAVLSLLGDRVDSLRIPFIQKTHTRFDAQRRGGFWDWVARTVMRQPVITLLTTSGILVAFAVAAFYLNTGFAGVSTLPDDLQSKEGFLILEEDFSFGLVTPADIVIDGDIASEEVQAGLAQLRSDFDADPSFSKPPPLQVNPQGDLALLSVPVAGDPNNDEAIQAVKRLRNQYIPRAFKDAPAEVLVTGETAFNSDFFQLIADYTPAVFAFVLGLSFILLTVVFRSLVVPLKAILMNLLSVGAAYGLMVLVFQEGIGNEIFGFQQVDIVEAWIPLFLFSILFGLSMDYHVFLLSRIRERYDQTGDNTESVAFGLRSTGRLISGAAVIMVAVFSGFASGDLVGFQQVGFGLAVAILLDATAVRIILVPSAMKLLGRANWYLPSVLQWLPRATVEVQERPAPGPAASAKT